MCRAERAGALLALVAVACTASDPAPKKWQRSIQQAQTSPYGSWVIVELASGNLDGELIAVDSERLLIGRGGKLVPVRTSAVKKVTVSAYAADATGVAAFAVLGTLSTVSHGFFLIFSAPLWALIGGGLTRSASGEGFLELDGGGLDELRRWARFPQGLPADFRVGTPARRSPVPPAPRGGDGQVCYPNLTCNAGLECDRSTVRCRPVPALGSQGGRCFASGACDPGLVCQEGTCAPPPP